MSTTARELRLSMWTSLYWEFSPEDALRHIASLGWGFVDFSAEHLGLLWREGSAAHMREVRALMNELDVEPYQTHGPMQSEPMLAGGAALEKWLELVRGWLEAAGELGVKHFVLHTADDPGMSRDDVFRANAEGFRRLAADAERTNVKVAVENTCNRFGSTPAELLELIDAVGSPMLCICLDSSHANVQGLDIAETVKGCGSALACLHLSDNDGSGDQHRLPFDGTVDWYALARALREADYPGTLNFELGGLFWLNRALPIAVRDIQMKYVESILAEVFNPASEPGYPVRDEPQSELCKVAWISEYGL